MRNDIACNSTKFIISSKFILQVLSFNIFHKKIFNIYQASCFQIVSSFTTPLRLLGAPNVLNQMSFVWNFAFVNLFSISNKLRSRFSKKASVLVLLWKKDFPLVFCWVLLQKYSELENESVLSKSWTYFYFSISNFCVGKSSWQYHEIYLTWSLPKLRMFLQNLSS